MYSNGTSLNRAIPTECVHFQFLGGKLDDTTTEAYVVLVLLIVVTILTCPLTISLNALVITAVKTKHRLRSNCNTVLACLAVADGLIGVIAQPMLVATLITTLQGDKTKEYCMVDLLTNNVIRVVCAAAFFHLVVMNVERYLAIKHSFSYTTMVTKTRILTSSAAGWIVAVAVTIPLIIADKTVYLKTNNIMLVVCFAIIAFCQISVFAETRRHEREIAAQQISLEARQKFLKEKKALKVTTAVLLVLILCFSPIFVVRVLLVAEVVTSVNTSYISFYVATVVKLLNSFINPVIYCVRIRQFRVAFIQILLKKDVTQAEQFERRLFGRSNVVAPPQEEHELREGQNDDQANINEDNDIERNIPS